MLKKKNPERKGGGGGGGGGGQSSYECLDLFPVRKYPKSHDCFDCHGSNASKHVFKPIGCILTMLW